MAITDRDLEHAIEASLKKVRWHAKTVRELPHWRNELQLNTFKNSMPSNVIKSTIFFAMVDILCVLKKKMPEARVALDDWLVLFPRTLQRRVAKKTFGSCTAEVYNDNRWIVLFKKTS